MDKMAKQNQSIPPAIRDLLKKMEFLSMAQKGQKPCMSDMTFVSSKSWSGWYKRVWNSEGKKSLILNIEQIIDDAIQSIKTQEKGPYKHLLVLALERMKDGLENMMETYKGSPMTVASLKVCMNNINLQLDDEVDRD